MAQTAACFLGIDVRRDGLGLAVLAANGAVLGTLDRSYTGTPSDTSDPQDWWRAARTGIKELLRRVERPASSIRCIGVTGDSSAFVALDRDGKVLCPSTFGPDPKVAQYVDEVVRKVGLRNLVNLAGAPATTACMAVKLCWLRDNEKRAWHDLAWIVPAKDFIRFRLTKRLKILRPIWRSGGVSRSSSRQDAQHTGARAFERRRATGAAAATTEDRRLAVDVQEQALNMTCQRRDPVAHDSPDRHRAVGQQRRVSGELFAHGPRPCAGDQAAGVIDQHHGIERSHAARLCQLVVERRDGIEAPAQASLSVCLLDVGR